MDFYNKNNLFREEKEFPFIVSSTREKIGSKAKNIGMDVRSTIFNSEGNFWLEQFTVGFGSFSVELDENQVYFCLHFLALFRTEQRIYRVGFSVQKCEFTHASNVQSDPKGWRTPGYMCLNPTYPFLKD